MIKQLYAAEHQAATMTVEQRTAFRQRESKPIVEEFHTKISEWKSQLLPKQPMMLAINYSLNQLHVKNLRWLTDGERDVSSVADRKHREATTSGQVFSPTDCWRPLRL
jgi:hypothetical protein